MPAAEHVGHKFSPFSIDGVCRVALTSPGVCCFGACLDGATHAVVVKTGDAEVEHHRCPTHLAWSQDRQAAAIVSTRELGGS